MCTIIIQEAYCLSQNSHIKKNKLINKQQRHNEKDAMTSSMCFVFFHLKVTPYVYPLGKMKIEHSTLCNSPEKKTFVISLSMQCYKEETQLTSQLPGTCVGHAAVVEWRL